ncbi:STAS domain-containing protein [Cesiribacter andamanensis]|uniref:STAS domain-containing protein n=1 Tax=Cesiribacter andamanensis AMV16 TaxID=1279009 RepID=M7N5R9_9BACT|nr:STAS domain-containing protein [Cesiribacter andamanensis]EMR03978.1 hypothetical protein ADICEAN_00849 [Cesiribacter andamanensis AMV16]
MHHTLESDPAGRPSALVLSGNFSIAHSEQLRQLLLQHCQPERPLLLRVGEIEVLDLSFLQLLLAFTQPLAEGPPPYQLHRDLSPQLQQLLRLAGLTLLTL